MSVTPNSTSINGKVPLPRRLGRRDLVEEPGDLRPDAGDRLAGGLGMGRRCDGDRQEGEDEGDEGKAAVLKCHIHSHAVGRIGI